MCVCVGMFMMRVCLYAPEVCVCLCWYVPDVCVCLCWYVPHVCVFVLVCS